MSVLCVFVVVVLVVVFVVVGEGISDCVDDLCLCVEIECVVSLCYVSVLLVVGGV